MRSGLVGQDVRAAIYQALTRVRGLKVTERQVVTDDVDDFEAGTVLMFTSVTTGVVDVIGVKPAG